MTSTKQIIHQFIKQEINEFKVASVYNSVDLHKKFQAYLHLHPIDANVKYYSMFNNRTKQPLRQYLIDDLDLKYVSRKKGYFIDYRPGYCEKVNHLLSIKPS